VLGALFAEVPVGLSHSVTYKFKVAAVNAIGTSVKSAYSNAITTT